MSHTQKRCRRKHTCIVEQHVYATETRNSSSYYAVDRPRTPDVTRDLKNVFARGIYALRSLCTKSHLACEAGVSIKPGAQAPGSDHQKPPKPVNTGDSVKFPVFRPLSRARALFIWHVNLGLAPQALCLRLLSQAKKYGSISLFVQSGSAQSSPANPRAGH
jgi:hypothetical protein